MVVVKGIPKTLPNKKNLLVCHLYLNLPFMSESIFFGLPGSVTRFNQPRNERRLSGRLGLLLERFILQYKENKKVREIK